MKYCQQVCWLIISHHFSPGYSLSNIFSEERLSAIKEKREIFALKVEDKTGNQNTRLKARELRKNVSLVLNEQK